MVADLVEAGGVAFSDLMQIPMNESNIHLMNLVMVVDLSQVNLNLLSPSSKPQVSFQLVQHFFQQLDAIVLPILSALEKRGSKRPKGMRLQASKCYGPDHPDQYANSASPFIFAQTPDRFSHSHPFHA